MELAGDELFKVRASFLARNYYMVTQQSNFCDAFIKAINHTSEKVGILA